MNLELDGTRYNITPANVLAMWAALTKPARLRLTEQLTPSKPRGVPPKYTDEQRKEVVRLYRDRLSMRLIGVQTGLTKQTVNRILKKEGT